MTYTIFKGFHFSLPPFPIFFYKKRSFQRVVKFDSSIIYDIGKDQGDIHKLWGIHWGKIHSNSARFGMRYNSGKGIEILAYCYDKGVRVNTNENEKVVCTLTDYGYYSTKIREMDNQYFFSVEISKDNWVHAHQLKTYKPPALGFFSRPYFGGNRTAPHKIKIKML